MAIITSNKKISQDMYMMKIEGQFKGKAGQFYMMKNDQAYPLLGRPISIHDIDKDSISFLYRVVGEGTEIFAQKQAGDQVILNGPYGNGFEKRKGNVALVGGGMGVAPLYQTAKEMIAENGKIDVYLGFAEEAIIKEKWEGLDANIIYNIGGIITDDVEPSKYEIIYSCGPEPMLEALYKKCKPYDTEVYVSIESKMACGVGACLVCSCATKEGRKKICKDGPVFRGEVIYE